MAYKPEKIGRTHLSPGATRRIRRDAKKAAARVMRRLARRDPENAPRALVTRGWID